MSLRKCTKEQNYSSQIDKQENANVSPLNISWSSDEEIYTSWGCGSTMPDISYCKTQQNKGQRCKSPRKTNRKRKIKVDFYKSSRKVLSKSKVGAVVTQTKSDLRSKVLSTSKPVEQEVRDEIDEYSTEDEIEWSSSDEASAKNTPNKSQVIDTPSTSQNQNECIAKPENNTTKLQQNPLRRRSLKRAPKGSLLRELELVLESTKSESRFLEYDKKFGLRVGVKVIVLKKESSFDVHMVTVRSNEDENNIFSVIVYEDMFKNIQVGSMLEVFFNEDTGTYINRVSATKERIFIQPHKILVL